MDRRIGAFLCVWLGLAIAASESGATVRYGNVQLSGNLQAQLLFRTPSYDEIQMVQERNTFRLQYEHKITENGEVAGIKLPGIKSLDLFAYYRFVYDSIYDIKPGGVLENQDGSRGTKFDEIPSPNDVKFENVIREVFADIQLDGLPVSLRIGRQQISWGEALISRALDSVNPLDLTWHLFYEAGLFGKVGFDELRVPAWTIKALWDIGSLGPLSNVFVEAYDIPFQFNPAEVHTASDSPFSLPFRNPFRGGLAIDLTEQLGLDLEELGLPPALANIGSIQPCFDLTGNQQSNADAGIVFDDSVSKTGKCNTPGMKETSFRTGNYDRHDPSEVNQWGIRFAATTPNGISFTLNYMYRRNTGADIPGSGVGKFYSGRVLGSLTSSPLDFVALSPHETYDASAARTTQVLGYLRIPVQIYYPYVNIFGASAVYADDYTGAVFNMEGTFTHDLPVFNANAFGNGIEKRDVILAAFGIDRPISIPSLNRRSTFQTFAQLNINYILGHEDVEEGPALIPLPGAPGLPTRGDVGIPNSALIPGAFYDSSDVDDLKQIEMLSLLGFATFYKGGSVNPVAFWISDWTNAPAMAWFLFLDWYVTNDIIITPRVNIFTTFGRPNVNDTFAIGRSGGAG
ncbi:MAG: DUF1302 family protein, partial [Candidatus Binatia bacterium]